MSVVALIKPKEVSIPDAEGIERVFIVGRMPATVGRRVLSTYPSANLPKWGDAKASEAAMMEMMRYVAVRHDDGTETRLSTQALIDNHVADGEQLIRLEAAMMSHNVSFFGAASGSSLADSLTRFLAPVITRILTPSSAPSSEQD